MKFDLSGLINKGKKLARQHGPVVLVYSGIVGTLVGGVLACVATRKVDDVMAKHRKNVEAIHSKHEAEGQDNGDERREITAAYAKTGMEFVRLYAPSVAIGACSVAGILAGNNILRKRNVALAAACMALDTSFKQYRCRVMDRYGEEAELAIRTGGEECEIEFTEVNEDGEEKKTKKKALVVDGQPSDYARYFCYGESRAAEPNDDYNAFFLRGQLEIANHMLRAKGMLFLNDVYDMLGYDRTLAGQTVGWVYDPENDDHGDNYIDFGMKEVYMKDDDAPDGYRKAYLLDFNVDGNILEHAVNKGLILR